ncbi:hybrid sensor histidine kinase/response regulator [Frigidibacter oleivorans]|uniref:hybrid sensor histidine kinase/response regulator n=1 Tax=Frigidibacter oleivorans TaxID=2487129 RepID=UPI000F8C9AFA|nr:ATP-binding protein [Frigidibacter oleivorans]
MWLIACGGLLALAALVLPARMTLPLVTAGLTLVAVAVVLRLLAQAHQATERRLRSQIAAFVAHDHAPVLTTDAEGEVGYQNRAALDRFGPCGGQSLARALSDLLAGPAAALPRLQNRALAQGAAREDLATRHGHVRLSVHRLGEGGFLWRIEDLGDRGAARGEGASLPMLVATRSGTILFMNEALRRLAGERMKTLDALFADLPLAPGDERDILTVTGRVRVLPLEIEGAGGRREIYLLPAQRLPPRSTADPAAFEGIPVALLRVAATGEVLAANRAARGLLGTVERGTPLSDLLEGLGRPVPDWLADAMAGRADRRPEVLRLRSPDREQFLQVTLARLQDDHGPGLLAMLHDATALKTLEAQFVQSQKMQAIGQLAGGVAHDFNNLLTAISGHCDLMLLRHGTDDPDYPDLVQVQQNANRAASLVRQLLAFSRKQTLQPEVLDLRDTMSDLTHLLNRLLGEKVALTLSHDPDLRPIRADRRQLEQVFINLAVNARDAMPAGGAIRIATVNRHLPEPFRRDRAVVPPGDHVVVTVSDEGVGIPADRLQKIFEPFFTTKRAGEGTGLGLSTAYGIVKQTGGFIFVDSVEGAGTTFTLWFPALDAAALAGRAAAPARRAPQAGGTGTVLLVEDEAPVRAFASRALQLCGYAVVEADSGEAALKLLADPALSVDLFISDVVMPGIDGPGWVREALAARPGVRVVFMSGYAEDAVQSSQARVPDAVFLQKPFSLAELTATVQQTIG